MFFVTFGGDLGHLSSFGPSDFTGGQRLAQDRQFFQRSRQANELIGLALGKLQFLFGVGMDGRISKLAIKLAADSIVDTRDSVSG